MRNQSSIAPRSAAQKQRHPSYPPPSEPVLRLLLMGPQDFIPSSSSPPDPVNGKTEVMWAPQAPRGVGTVGAWASVEEPAASGGLTGSLYLGLVAADPSSHGHTPD